MWKTSLRKRLRMANPSTEKCLKNRAYLPKRIAHILQEVYINYINTLNRGYS